MRHKYMNVIVIRHLYVLLLHLRREGDSNPRASFAGYTLSRRACSIRKLLIFNDLYMLYVKFAVYLQFFRL